MRFFYVKHEQLCRQCKSFINYGEEAVIIRWKSPDSVIIPLVFHTACYIDWATNSFINRWKDWRLGANPRPVKKKRGRKFLYKSREQAKEVNRVKALLSYHKKLNNETRVQELQIKLLEVTTNG